MIALHRDPGSGEAIAELPAWIRPANGDGYWHAPRSARRSSRGWISVTFWCGPGRSARRRDFTDDAPERMKCGTCIGRRGGYFGADGSVFRPRDHFKELPKRCPGADRGDGRCALCGSRIRYRNGWVVQQAEHRPEPALRDFVTPCPEHGWRDLRSDAGCNVWGCGWNGWRLAQ